jgi:NRPS condensation-like uncharacterized protein
LTELAKEQSSAQQLWRSRVRDGSPFMRVINMHALPGHAIAMKMPEAHSDAPSLVSATTQQLRALGGAYARLLRARNKQPERFVATQKSAWLCMPLMQQRDAMRFQTPRTQGELLAAAAEGRDAAVIRRCVGLP